MCQIRVGDVTVGGLSKTKKQGGGQRGGALKKEGLKQPYKLCIGCYTHVINTRKIQSIYIKEVTEEGNSQNEIRHRTNNDIRVAVQS